MEKRELQRREEQVDKSLNQDNYYLRHTTLPNIGKSGQEKLGKAKVLVVGSGGLGSPALLYLAALGIGEIGIVDYDTVDVTNLSRQVIFNIDDIGKSKAEVAKAKLSKINPFIKIDVYDTKIEIENAEDIISKYDIVLDCTDNFRAKFIIHDTCYLLKKDLIQASIYQFEGVVYNFSFSKDKAPCFRCLWDGYISDGCVKDCATAGVLGINASIVGSYQAWECVKTILGFDTLKIGESYHIDLISNRNMKLKFNQRDDCDLCKTDKITKIEEDNYMEKIEISATKALENSKDYVFVDIRETNEFESLPCTKDLKELQKGEGENMYEFLENLEDGKNYAIFCHAGSRSYAAVSHMKAMGKENFLSVAGGVQAINEA